MKTNSLFVMLVMLFALAAKAQFSANVDLVIEPKSIQGLMGVHSFVPGQWAGHHFVIGGRIDGLHQRQPFASFLASGNNTSIQIIDFDLNLVQQLSLTTLSSSLQEQLQSTNAEYVQMDSFLFVFGGYGFSATANNHITYPYVTRINLASLLRNTQQQQPIDPCFVQLNDARFAVTGGYAGQLDGTIYLVGGQLFNGRYNPQGPNFGPGFTQQYTSAIKRFELQNNPQQFSIANYREVVDTALLHRRDYNMLPQIFADHSLGFTAFTGVFQPNVDLPWLNCVDITPDQHAEIPDFQQFLSQYHSASIAVFDSSDLSMKSVFFGGIARYYYDESGNLIDDSNAPFVKTISMVNRKNDGSLTEKKLGDMPDLLGAGAHFYPNPLIPTSSHGVLLLPQNQSDSLLLGRIFGGIKSTQPNIFFVNNGTQSSASAAVYEVWLKPNIAQHVDASLTLPTLHIWPNPGSGLFQIEFNKTEKMQLNVLSISGVMLKQNLNLQPTENGQFQLDLSGLATGIYILQLSTNAGIVTKTLSIVK